MERWNKFEDIPSGYREMAKRYIDAGALRGKDGGALDLTEDMLRTMEIMRRYFEGGRHKNMNAPDKAAEIKAAAAALIAFGTALFGWVGWMVVLWLIAMLLDYLTGTFAAL